MIIVSVFDSKLGEFNGCQAFPNEAVAFRSWLNFLRTVNENDKDDYQFFKLGELDVVSGEITRCPPRVVGGVS